MTLGRGGSTILNTSVAPGCLATFKRLQAPEWLTLGEFAFIHPTGSADIECQYLVTF